MWYCVYAYLTGRSGVHYSLDEFFNTPPVASREPSVVGFDGFFRGAFLYHYHNQW